MCITVHEADKIEITTLQDNYIELSAGDNTDIIQRARPLKGLEMKNSILAEHGFSSLVTITSGKMSRTILFDFGFSEHGAAYNADVLDIDLTSVEVMALSHGHLDHVGGLEQLSRRVKKKNVELVLHPSAFKTPRYVKVSEELKIFFPPFTREKALAAGVTLRETNKPYPLLDNHILFLGEIPRKTEFEKGMPNAYFEEDGKELWDPIDDDTAIVANIRDRGLVIISGCAHSGIINTVNFARELTGIEKVYAIVGGFHLTGPDWSDITLLTTEALNDINPEYIVPTHCTGRKAIMYMEMEMPHQFLLNMSGTTLLFSA